MQDSNPDIIMLFSQHMWINRKNPGEEKFSPFLKFHDYSILFCSTDLINPKTWRGSLSPLVAHTTLRMKASLPKQVGFYLEKANEQTAMAVFLTAEKTPGWWRSGDVTPTRKGVVPSLQEIWYLRFLVGLNKENHKGRLKMVRGRIR